MELLERSQNYSQEQRTLERQPYNLMATGPEEDRQQVECWDMTKSTLSMETDLNISQYSKLVHQLGLHVSHQLGRQFENLYWTGTIVYGLVASFAIMDDFAILLFFYFPFLYFSLPFSSSSKFQGGGHPPLKLFGGTRSPPMYHITLIF